jgi:hypothetical protein
VLSTARRGRNIHLTNGGQRSLILVDGGSSVISPVEGEADDVISCLYDRHCNLSFCSPFLAWEAAGEHWMGGRG